MSIENEWAEKSEHDSNYAIAYALCKVAAALRMLGTADAATPMGAIELLAMEVKEGTERISSRLSDIEQALQ